MEPIIAVMPNGTIQLMPNVTVGQALEALELARRAILNVALNSTPPNIVTLDKEKGS